MCRNIILVSVDTALSEMKYLPHRGVREIHNDPEAINTLMNDVVCCEEIKAALGSRDLN